MMANKVKYNYLMEFKLYSILPPCIVYDGMIAAQKELTTFLWIVKFNNLYLN